MLDGPGVSRAENRADVISASEVVEHDVDGVAWNIWEFSGGYSCVVWFECTHGLRMSGFV